jgi:hypothetical protein
MGSVASFPGGSAYAMAREIAGGFLLVTDRTFKRFSAEQLRLLSFELERLIRDVRSEQPDLDDMKAIQKRNRTLQRVTSARLMLQNFLQRQQGRAGGV